MSAPLLKDVCFSCHGGGACVLFKFGTKMFAQRARFAFEICAQKAARGQHVKFTHSKCSRLQNKK